MFKITMPIVGLVLLSAHPSVANDCDTNNTPLTAAQIQTLLLPAGNNVYACGTSGTEKWNETLVNSTDVWDYKLGSGNATDPSTKVATYVITGAQTGAGSIQYNYGGTAQFTYEIAPVGPNTTFPNMGQYYFCQTAGGSTDYTIMVTLGPGTC
jgi:hypothetical protein